MIALNQVSMVFGHKVLFFDVNLLLQDNSRYALVGANGCGKSTLFKLLSRMEECSDGQIQIPKSATIGFLKQDHFQYEDTPLVDVVLQGKPALWSALQEKEKLLAYTEWDEKISIQFGNVEEVIQHEDGYTAHIHIENILIGLGIPKEQHNQPLKTLSGGYKLRVLLAQTLFSNPSILLLDEPTNHLDIVSIRWLETFLTTTFKGLLIFISHELGFIDHVATNILDIDYGEVRAYSSPYAKFLEEKHLLEEQKRIERQSAEAKIAHLQSFVDRFGAKASKATLAQSRLKMIEKIELPDIKHSSRIAPHFQFSIHRPSGKQVLKVQKLKKSYPDRLLFENLSFDIQRGDKIAVLGENGIGKSTLIKIILGLIPQDEGTITPGHEVSAGYFSQDSHELLHESMTALEFLHQSTAQSTDQAIRKTLGNMLFKQDDALKNILSISGGEAARLLLAKIILEKPNFLLLDEPTNHLDLESIDALANALIAYTGTLLFVSHNEYFIEKVANRIIYFSRTEGIRQFKGRYVEF
jgi:ATPase subunit of ABC transporter with duplicated ATPase domains